MPIETFTAQVESIENLTHDVRRLDLRLVEPNTITFKPGQFISFEMPDLQTGRLLTRAYSIASQPNRSGVITLLFNLVSGGPGSGFLFHLKAGEKTQFKGPAGHFYLREDPERELLFVASGTGIAPIRSMLLANAERPDPRPATLFWGLRSQRDLYEQEELAELSRRMPTLTAITTLSRPDPGWSGSSGRVLRLIEERISSVKNLAVYLCRSSAPRSPTPHRCSRKKASVQSTAKNTTTEKGMEADDLFCSCNARSRTPLVGRAQWKINQPPSLRNNERAWKEHFFPLSR
jgi:NAD(P)H-flavin reductase